MRTGAALAQTTVDLELVIAVDVSLSMDLDEQRLQRDGYVAAFRDPEVHKAIVSGPNGRIPVTYIEWAGPPTQHRRRTLDHDRRAAGGDAASRTVSRPCPSRAPA